MAVQLLGPFRQIAFAMLVSGLRGLRDQGAGRGSKALAGMGKEEEEKHEETDAEKSSLDNPGRSCTGGLLEFQICQKY